MEKRNIISRVWDSVEDDQVAVEYSIHLEAFNLAPTDFPYSEFRDIYVQLHAEEI